MGRKLSAVLAGAVAMGGAVAVQATVAAPAEAGNYLDCSSGRLCYWNDTWYNGRRWQFVRNLNDTDYSNNGTYLNNNAEAVYNRAPQSVYIYKGAGCLPGTGYLGLRPYDRSGDLYHSSKGNFANQISSHCWYRA